MKRFILFTVLILIYFMNPLFAQDVTESPSSAELEFVEEKKKEKEIAPILVDLYVSGDRHVVREVESFMIKELTAMKDIVLEHDIPEYVINIVVLEGSLKTGQKTSHISMSVLVEDRYGSNLKGIIFELIDKKNEEKWLRYVEPVFDYLVMIQGNTLYLTNKESLLLTCNEILIGINTNIFEKIRKQRKEALSL